MAAHEEAAGAGRRGAWGAEGAGRTAAAGTSAATTLCPHSSRQLWASGATQLGQNTQQGGPEEGKRGQKAPGTVERPERHGQNRTGLRCVTAGKQLTFSESVNQRPPHLLQRAGERTK